MQLLEGSEHATEVLADELLDQGLAGEADSEVAGNADLIDKISASLEGELLGENEGVIAIEQQGSDLWRGTVSMGLTRNSKIKPASSGLGWSESWRWEGLERAGGRWRGGYLLEAWWRFVWVWQRSNSVSGGGG